MSIFSDINHNTFIIHLNMLYVKSNTDYRFKTNRQGKLNLVSVAFSL